MCVYLRCVGSHYPIRGPDYYRNILQRTNHSALWLFLDPGCPKTVDKVTSASEAAILYLRKEHGARLWEARQESEMEQVVADFFALTACPRLVLPPGSTWAFWAGLLSAAREVHVDAKTHKLLPGMPQYLYHDEEKKAYFGRAVMRGGSSRPEIEYKYVESDG